MSRKVVKGSIYRHFKGNFYRVVEVAEHTETGESLVIYKSTTDDGKVYARPIEMFTSKVDKEKYPDVTQEYRFEPVSLKSLFSQLSQNGNSFRPSTESSGK